MKDDTLTEDQILKAATVYVGCDLARINDLTAYVILAKIGENGDGKAVYGGLLRVFSSMGNSETWEAKSRRNKVLDYRYLSEEGFVEINHGRRIEYAGRCRAAFR